MLSGSATGPRSVLLALDFSTYSALAFSWAKATLLSPDRDSVVLAHVIQPNNVVGLQADTATELQSALALGSNLEADLKTEEEVNTYLAEYVDALKEAKIDCSTKILYGEPSSAIIEESANGYDLIVIGCRGHGAMKRVLLGSVSSSVAHGAHCPVLIVREPPLSHAPQSASAAKLAALRQTEDLRPAFAAAPIEADGGSVVDVL